MKLADPRGHNDVAVTNLDICFQPTSVEVTFVVIGGFTRAPGWSSGSKVTYVTLPTSEDEGRILRRFWILFELHLRLVIIVAFH